MIIPILLFRCLKLDHYSYCHRRGSASSLKPFETVPGQGIGRHRPWERKSPDRSWEDRF